MKIPTSIFGDLASAEFLSSYWHKKPLLVRNAWPGFGSIMSPKEFMKLASRADAYSRILVRGEGEHEWEYQEGPFESAHFESMPDSQWTLLIQEVDRLVPEVRDMIQAVSFLPKWRLDDVMISYAANGGGVGAHIDNYDVFLLQGYGQRRWQINTVPVEEETLVEGIDVSILADFEPDQEWILEPGDLLYLPPRVAHFGVALGPCMTYSIGCRAPSAVESLSSLLEFVQVESDPNERYVDPDLQMGTAAGRVGPDSVAWVKSLLKRVIDDEQALTEMVGMMLSQPRRLVDEEALSIHPLERALTGAARLRPATSSQVLYEPLDEKEFLFFAAGEPITLDIAFFQLVKKLIEGGGLSADDLDSDKEFGALLTELYGQGTLVVHD